MMLVILAGLETNRDDQQGPLGASRGPVRDSGVCQAL